MTEVNVILNAVKDLKKKDSSPRLRMSKQCKTRNDRGNARTRNDRGKRHPERSEGSEKERFFAKAQNDKVMQGLRMTEVNVILNAVKDLKKKDSSPRLRMTKQCKDSE